jgi:hypothetical protein
MIHPDIYSYVKGEENDFEADEVRLGDNWSWNFRDHVQLIFHLKHSIFYTGENNWLRAFKQVMRPLLRLSYWTEDIEVKDVVFFIEQAKGRALSFLIKKYHDEVFVREHDIDTMIDEITESDIDYGGVVVQKTNSGRPEVLPLNAIAFCDQTDILGGPIAFKHHFSPEGLRKMGAVGWGDEANGATISLEELITQADFQKEPLGMNDTKRNEVPGKVIEVYIVRGNLPSHFLNDNDDMDDTFNQVQIIAFYTDKRKNKKGVTLFRKKEEEGNLKFHASEKVHGRALGYGDGESFLHPQIWTNFLTIHKTNLLEAASKVPLVTDDDSYQNRNKIQDMENLEITTIEDGKSIQLVPTAAPANIGLMEGAINEWFEQSQLLGAAFDPILGKEATSGTTFRGQERTVAQGRGWHDRRRGQRAKFIEEIYRDWIIPDIVKEIVKGKKFLANLTVEELSWIQDRLATNFANRKMVERTLESVANSKKPLPSQEEKDQVIQTFKEQFARTGDKHLVEVLKGEFKGIEVKMGINIANKQKDLVNLSDKLLSIFQFVFANPQGFQQAMQIPALAKSFTDILEFSGLNQTDFLSLTQPPTQAPETLQQPQQQLPQQAQPLALNSQPNE